MIVSLCLVYLMMSLVVVDSYPLLDGVGNEEMTQPDRRDWLQARYNPALSNMPSSLVNGFFYNNQQQQFRPYHVPVIHPAPANYNYPSTGHRGHRLQALAIILGTALPVLALIVIGSCVIYVCCYYRTLRYS